MKKKIVISTISLFLFLAFLFFFKRANAGYPKSAEIETYRPGEEIDIGDFSFKVKKAEFSKEESSGYPILAVDFSFKNKTEEKMDLSALVPSLILYEDFEPDIIQNLDDEGREFLNESYKKEDLFLLPDEDKTFTFKYILDGKRHRSNLIYISINAYKKEYEKAYKEGVLYYKAIDLGGNI